MNAGEEYKKYMGQYPVINLQFLSQCLEKYYDKKVIILIDEYDVPLENAYFEDFYDEMVSFLRSLFESALKTNPSLEFAVLTGCLRISKESIFTGLNDLEIISILNRSYDEYFGFTQKEVDETLEYYDLMNKRELIKEWYKVNERMDSNTKQKYIELQIPNQEVKYIFRTKILKWVLEIEE